MFLSWKEIKKKKGKETKRIQSKFDIGMEIF